MSESCLPEVFVVGAAKSGTSAIHDYFRVHPQVFVPASVKETNYMAFFEGIPDFTGPGDQLYARKSVATLKAYTDLYRSRGESPVAADVSPFYLYSPKAAAKIAELRPEAKIVMVLRNPIECAFSMYSMQRRSGLEPARSFSEAFALSKQRLADRWAWGWDYKGFFEFAKQVERYLNQFPATQLFIRRYEELNTRPEAFYHDLMGFIGVREIDASQSNRRVNEGARRVDLMLQTPAGRVFWQGARMAGKLTPKSFKVKVLRNLLLEPVLFKKSFLFQRGLVLKPAERRMLIEHYGDDIRELSKLLNWNLDDWLAC